MLGLFQSKAETRFQDTVVMAVKPDVQAKSEVLQSSITYNKHPSGFYCKACAVKHQFPDLSTLETEKVGNDYYFDFTECDICKDDGAHYFYSMVKKG